MKTKPTLRYKKRYILFQTGLDPKGIGREDLKKEIFRNILSLLGELDAANARARLVFLEAGHGILRCTPEYVDKCIVALVCMKKINKADVFVDVKGVFGTLKKAKEVI